MKQGLKEQYEKKILPEIQKELGIKNKLAAPRLEKVVVNVGLGRASQSANFKDKILPEVMKEISLITGQKPSLRKAKKSISGFKLREGEVIGLKVTLRGLRMFDFIDKLIKIVYPRVRDFRGIDLKNVDKKGNLNVGFRDHYVFPEISQETSTVDFGLQVTVVCKAKRREDALVLYRHLGFLFKESKTKSN
jgi:large subunit ribosomal protein L5